MAKADYQDDYEDEEDEQGELPILIDIFNGSRRSFGGNRTETAKPQIFFQIYKEFGPYIHYFPRSMFHVFMALVFASRMTEEGVMWTNPSIKFIRHWTHLNPSTITNSVNELLALNIKGHRVLMRVSGRGKLLKEGKQHKGEFDYNSYIIFPKESDFEEWGEIEKPPTIRKDSLKNDEVKPERFAKVVEKAENFKASNPEKVKRPPATRAKKAKLTVVEKPDDGKTDVGKSTTLNNLYNKDNDNIDKSILSVQGKLEPKNVKNVEALIAEVEAEAEEEIAAEVQEEKPQAEEEKTEAVKPLFFPVRQSYQSSRDRSLQLLAMLAEARRKGTKLFQSREPGARPVAEAFIIAELIRELYPRHYKDYKFKKEYAQINQMLQISGMNAVKLTHIIDNEIKPNCVNPLDWIWGCVNKYKRDEDKKEAIKAKNPFHPSNVTTLGDGTNEFAILSSGDTNWVKKLMGLEKVLGVELEKKRSTSLPVPRRDKVIADLRQAIVLIKVHLGLADELNEEDLALIAPPA
jgi:hypothetical protein